MDEVERELVQIWSAVLGVDEVGLDDDFFELGGDSLAAASVFAGMADAIGFALPYSVMLELSTIRELAVRIRSEGDTVGSLVKIQVTGDRVPLFAVHDVFGGIFFAKHLARHLGQLQPVYGLRPPDGSGVSLESLTFEELAQHYLAEMRRVRPVGPYRLYGFSFGGLLAFEMAIQLQRQGEAVDLLVIGDAPAPSTLKRTAVADPDAIILGEIPPALSVRVRRYLGFWRRLPKRDAAMETLRLLRHARGVISLIRWRFSSEERQRRADAFIERGTAAQMLQLPLPRTLTLISQKYEPAGRFNGSILLIRTAENPSPWKTRSAAEDRGWEEHVTGVVTTKMVSCRHSEMANEPFISEISEIVGNALRVGTRPVRSEL